MKFIIEVKKLKKILPLISKICSGSLTLPILGNIFLELKDDKLTLSATNLEIGITASFGVKNVKKEGKITVSGRIFNDFISSLPEADLEIQEEEKVLKCKCLDFKANILGQDPKDFPPLPEIEGEKKAILGSKDFKEAVSKVSHVVSPRDSRVEISGINLEFDKGKIKIVGTDSIRLAQVSIENLHKISKPKSAIVPLNTMIQASYLFGGFEGNVNIYLSPNQVSFILEPKKEIPFEIKLISRLIEGKFPEYEEILPKEFKLKAIFQKEELLQKIKTVSLFSSQVQDIKLDFRPDQKKLLLSSESAEKGEAKAEIEGEMEGIPLEILFNFKYLLDGILPVFSSEVFFGATDPLSPVMIEPVGIKDYFYILMPKSA